MEFRDKKEGVPMKISRIIHSRHVSMMAAGVLILLTSACASVAPDTSTAEVDHRNEHSDLYDGKSTTTFATEFAPTSAAEARQLGDVALHEGNLDKALYHYIQALDLDDKDVATLLNIASIHDHRDNQNLAGLAYQRALQIDRDNTQALTGVGLILMERRELATAKNVLTRSLEIDGAQWKVHNALGIIEDLEEHHQVAVDHYLAALELRPESPLVMNNLGYSYYLADNWPAAREMYKKAIAVDNGYKRAWQNLGLLHLREGSYRSALDAFSHTMESPQAYNDLGYLSMLEGNYALSEQLLEQAIDRSPSYYQRAHENRERVKELQRSTVLTGSR
jgi:Flp pilus assembly protein TadD